MTTAPQRHILPCPSFPVLATLHSSLGNLGLPVVWKIKGVRYSSSGALRGCTQGSATSCMKVSWTQTNHCLNQEAAYSSCVGKTPGPAHPSPIWTPAQASCGHNRLAQLLLGFIHKQSYITHSVIFCLLCSLGYFRDPALSLWTNRLFSSLLHAFLLPEQSVCLSTCRWTFGPFPVFSYND